MNKSILILLFLIGCTHAPKENKVLEMPLKKIWPLAESGNVDAMHALCYRHLYGEDGAKKNLKIAFDWCQKSAERGHNSSLTLLAEMYYLGHYTSRDYMKAFEYYKKAALLEHNHAQLVLYVMYTEGQGVEKNKEQASYWLQRAAMNGNEQAKKLMAD